MQEVAYHLQARPSLRRRSLVVAITALLAIALSVVRAGPSLGHSASASYNGNWTENSCNWRGSTAHYSDGFALGVSEKLNQFCENVRVRIRYDTAQGIFWTQLYYSGSGSSANVSRQGHLRCSQHGGQGPIHPWVTKQISLPHGC